MSPAAVQPDLIISLSRDKVRINLSEEPVTGRNQWQTSFDIDGLFLEEQIAMTLDRVLVENPSLMDQFPCVEVIVLDRPNICVPQHYITEGKLGQIASRHLRLRSGDTLTTDASEGGEVICYTVPTGTLLMLKEYYANINCHHLTSILWHALSTLQQTEKNKTRLYFTTIRDLLMVLIVQNGKLIFSKNFNLMDKPDLYYYIIGVSRLLQAKEHWLVSIEDQETPFEITSDKMLKIDQRLALPSLHVLMTQYKLCES